MARAQEQRQGRTYLPSEESADQLGTFVRQLERFANRQATLISASAEEVVLPEQLFDVLKRVAGELAAGRGVTVMPRDMQLTTQQAADLLGVSRPTLIRLLEQGRISFQLVGRHRRILLADLERYREQARAERRAVLRQAAREGQQDGLHDLAGTLPKQERTAST